MLKYFSPLRRNLEILRSMTQSDQADRLQTVTYDNLLCCVVLVLFWFLLSHCISGLGTVTYLFVFMFYQY